MNKFSQKTTWHLRFHAFHIECENRTMNVEDIEEDQTRNKAYLKTLT